jgi:hypothetical protein
VNQPRMSRLPTLVAFLRNNPNLAYHLNEIAAETGIPVSSSSGALTREHNKPGSNIVRTSSGMYMWSTAPNKPQPETATETSPDPTKLDLIGSSKDGDNVYRDEDGNLWKAIFERL